MKHLLITATIALVATVAHADNPEWDKIPSEVKQEAVATCKQMQGNNWDVVDYCIKDRLNGWLKLQQTLGNL